MKASFRFTLLFVLFLGLIPSSCNTGSCDDPREYKLDLNDLSFKFLGAGLKIDTPAAVIPQGEFIIQVSLIGDDQFVSNISPEIPLFTQALIARDPCQPNHCSGFTVEIDSFTITCDTVFHGEAVGFALNKYFEALYKNKNSPGWPETQVAMAEFNESWRKDSTLLVIPAGVIPFKIKANVTIDPGNYRFILTMHLKDGTMIFRESDVVHFE